MSLLVNLFRLGEGKGPLRNFSEARFLKVYPAFVEVGRNPFEQALLGGIAWTESDFIPTAVNKTSGASGLMQIMPFHFDSFGWDGTQWTNPERNVRAGLKILEQSGLGKEPITVVLARYGGFVTVDPSDYIDKVLSRSAYLLPRFIF